MAERFERVFTLEMAKAVAAALRSDKLVNLEEACLKAGAPYNAVKMALKRLRKDECSPVEEPLAAMVALARSEQCKELLRDGAVLAGDGKSAAFAMWMAETRHPAEYSRKLRMEHGGEDGEPIKTETTLTAAGMSTEKLLEIWLQTGKEDA